MKTLICALSVCFFYSNYSFSQKVSNSTSYHIAGYLPENPDQKVYIKIQDRQIREVSIIKPNTNSIIETDAFIFPGIVNMHNHMEDSFLSLWKSARGQYKNRFEWRANNEYKLAVKSNEAAFDGDNEATCAAFRWAELKDLVGGATAVQGSGAKGSCVSNFGINNIEITGEFGNKSEIRSNLELVNPGNVKRVFYPYIKPKMDKGLSYDEALKLTMDETGVTAWIHNFNSKPRTLANGLALAFGDTLNATHTMNTEVALAEFEKLKPALIAKAKTLKDEDGQPEFRFDPKTQQSSTLNSYINALKIFLFGDSKSKGYLNYDAKKAVANISMNYLGQGGNRTIGSMKRYLTMFEFGLKQGAVNALNSKKASSFVTHLAEGMRSDEYNKDEFRIARDMGLLVPGMVLIHSVGMHVNADINPDSATLLQSDFKFAQKNNLSLVWSPFSNLLLYGETLDIVEARANNLNIAMGTDWSPTGSKNMLDELKIARHYIDKEMARKNLTQRQKKYLQTFNDKDLAQMATTNAYKAMNISHLVGQVEVGFQADLTLISRTAMNKNLNSNQFNLKTPYSAMVYGEQSDISLVVVKGQPLYGDTKGIQKASEIFKDSEKTEVLPQNDSRSVCQFTKSIRFPFDSALDQQIKGQRNFKSVFHMENLLNDILKKNKNVKEDYRATLDPLFVCQENETTQYGLRFNQFIEKEIEQNLMNRNEIRFQQKLNDKNTQIEEENNTH